MKFSVNTSEINNALSTATHALSARSTLPILEGILVETTENGISLTCSDGAMTIAAGVSAEIAEEGRIVMPGRLFMDVVRKLPLGEMMFSASANMIATIKCAGSRTTIAGKPSFHISVLADVSPYCDCHAENDVPIIPDVGFFASADPVAIDRACAEIAQQQPVVHGNRLEKCCEHGKPDDIFAATNPNTRWQSHFEHAERMGMGDGSYELVTVR